MDLKEESYRKDGIGPSPRRLTQAPGISRSTEALEGRSLDGEAVSVQWSD